MITLEIILGAALVFLLAVIWLMRRCAQMKSAQRPQAPRVVFTRSWEALSKDVIAKTLSEWPESDHRWRAVWEWLGDAYEEEMLSLMGQTNDETEMLVWKGRIQMLMHLRYSMLELRRQGARSAESRESE